MSWIYLNQQVEDPPENAVAFVYLITNMVTGRMYVGKKRLSLVRRVKRKGKTKRKVSRTDSGWRNYWGSNKTLLEEIDRNGSQYYKREILRWCTTLSEASYFETKEIFLRDCLLNPVLYYNEWVTCKITSKHMQRYIK